MSLQHTQTLITENISTILTEFPDCYIRALNNGKGKLKPLHRVDHQFAHIAVTRKVVNDGSQPGPFYHLETPKFLYVTSSCSFLKGGKYGVSFRKELVDIWMKSGEFPHIFWFPSLEPDKYAIIEPDVLADSFVAAGYNNKQLMNTYEVDGYEYISVWVPTDLKQKADECPENTLFSPLYAKSLTYIENASYSKFRRVNPIYVNKFVNGELVQTETFRSCGELMERCSKFIKVSGKTVLRYAKAQTVANACLNVSGDATLYVFSLEPLKEKYIGLVVHGETTEQVGLENGKLVEKVIHENSPEVVLTEEEIAEIDNEVEEIPLDDEQFMEPLLTPENSPECDDDWKERYQRFTQSPQYSRPQYRTRHSNLMW